MSKRMAEGVTEDMENYTHLQRLLRWGEPAHTFFHAKKTLINWNQISDRNIIFKLQNLCLNHFKMKIKCIKQIIKKINKPTISICL